MPKLTTKGLVASEHTFIEVADVHLEARWLAGKNDDSPVVIFLHEGLGCLDMWRDFPEKVVEQTGCHALVYSRQGYGRSDACSVPRPLTYMHIEALEVLPRLLKVTQVDDYILVGHSDGGSISLIHAGGTSARGLRGIVTMAPHVFCEELTVKSIAEAGVAYGQTDLRNRLAAYHYDNVDRAFWGWNKAWLDPAFMAWNIEEFLPAIKLPQLLIQGEDDQYGTVAQVEAIKSRSGGSVEVALLADCGHSPYKEQAEQSLALISGFVNRLVALKPIAL